MPGRLKVGVIFGGRSGEHDVSLRSAQAVMQAMDPTRFEVVPIGITREGCWLTGGDPLRRLAATSRLALNGGQNAGDSAARESDESSGGSLDIVGTGWARGLDVLFPMVHGPMGEDGTIQGLLELAQIPYVGAGVLGSAVAMDKAVSKCLFAQAGLPVPPWFSVARRDWQNDAATIRDRVRNEIGYPCFTKPANLGSSVGISKVHHAGELDACIEEAFQYDRKIVIERGIDARELEVGVLGNDEPQASVVGEILPCHEFYDYEAKYVDDRSQLVIPAEIEPETAALARSLATEAFRVTDGAGMARVDFFLERSTGRLYLNELNTIPGFTAASMYPKLWEASGLPLTQLISRLIDLALERHAGMR
ncbi:D-alanine--D-alanine ligase family protein [Nitrolancea hollandica]|uniref:D-alanine--D-alanine ligase family protein n=1 Tax=Nitrolancea hollandica TaxID=1206749 RepID=UPI0003073121|nr:D-alanine--D-alanine ligase family protein [Nitrolancea hollandica]